MLKYGQPARLTIVHYNGTVPVEIYAGEVI